MRRTVVTGMGIISSIGNNVEEVTESLRNLSSGIRLNEVNKEMGLRSHVCGSIENLNLKELIERKTFRFMGDAASYGYLSAKQAIQDSNLSQEDISSVRTGLIMGSGGASSEDQIDSPPIDSISQPDIIVEQFSINSFSKAPFLVIFSIVGVVLVLSKVNPNFLS